jgi:hypothetical protein
LHPAVPFPERSSTSNPHARRNNDRSLVLKRDARGRLIIVCCAPAYTQQRSLEQAKIQPALDGIFAAFSTHPLVSLADRHGLTQIIEFYEAIIRDPRFARDVRNVVVEFGGAAHQDVIDRYVNGDAVSYVELRGVWSDTIGWVPAVEHLGYAHFLRPGA